MTEARRFEELVGALAQLAAATPQENKTLDAVEACFQEMKLSFAVDKRQGRIKMQVDELIVKVVCRSSVVCIYVVFLEKCPRSARARLGEQFTDWNWALDIGAFELDFRDGEIKFKVSFPVAEPLSQRPFKLQLSTHLKIALDTAQSSRSSILGFMSGHTGSAAEAGDDTAPVLVAAIRGGASQTAIRLILEADSGAVSKCAADRVSPLVAAASRGQVDTCRLLLDHGADINHRTTNQDSALSVCVWKGHQECALLLLGRGADVNTADRFGDTPLLDAARHGHTAVVKALLEHQANVRHTNLKGESALGIAASGGHTEIVHLLQRAE